MVSFSPSLDAHCNKRVEKEKERDAWRRGEHAVVRCVSQLAFSKPGVCAKSDR